MLADGYLTYDDLEYAGNPSFLLFSELITQAVKVKTQLVQSAGTRIISHPLSRQETDAGGVSEFIKKQLQAQQRLSKQTTQKNKSVHS